MKQKMKPFKLKQLNAQQELWKCYESMTRKELIAVCKEQHLEIIAFMRQLKKPKRRLG